MQINCLEGIIKYSCTYVKMVCNDSKYVYFQIIDNFIIFH